MASLPQEVLDMLRCASDALYLAAEQLDSAGLSYCAESKRQVAGRTERVYQRYRNASSERGDVTGPLVASPGPGRGEPANVA